MNLIFNGPINDLSFGNVSINLLREFYKQDDRVVIFPMQDANYSAFDKIDKDFKSWIDNSINYNLHNISKDYPTLTLWHLYNSQNYIGNKNFLFTFHELDQVTMIEKNLSKLHEKVFLTNQEAVDAFEKLDCNNIEKINLGFDTDFFEIEEPIIKDKIHFVLLGKFEKRKHTKEIIKLWLDKYGNKKEFLLTCCVTNPWIKQDQFTNIIRSILNGKHYNNINFIPRLKTNSEINHLINSAHIDLTGLSGAEGWNLPAFNATALGKWSIVQNHTGHKSWATKDNCILIDPSGKEDSHDGLFFNNGGQYNQGNIYTFDSDKVSIAMDDAVKLANTKNTNGLKIQEDFSYANTVKEIKRIMNE